MKIAILGHDSGSYFLALKYKNEGHQVTLFRDLNITTTEFSLKNIRDVTVETLTSFDRLVSLTNSVSEHPFIKKLFENFKGEKLWADEQMLKLEHEREYTKNIFMKLDIPTPRLMNPDEKGKSVIKYNKQWLGGLQTSVVEELHNYEPMHGSFILEEFINIKREMSVHVFASKGSFKALPSARDYKKRYKGDTGHNTFSMGCYTTRDVPKEVYNHIKKFVEYNSWYSGIMYFGVAIDVNDNIFFLEFNCRYGNPEIISVMAPEGQNTVTLRVFKDKEYNVKNVLSEDRVFVDVLENELVRCAPDSGRGLFYFTLYSTDKDVETASKNIYNLVNSNIKFFEDRNLVYRTDIGILK